MKRVVLMVDDDDDDIYMYQNLFSEIAPELEFKSASDLDDLTQSYPEDDQIEQVPNIILLDLNLPRFNGIQIARILKEHKWLKEVPILVLTTSSSPLDMADCKKLGIHSYFIKPQDYNDCKALIESIYQYWFKLNSL